MNNLESMRARLVWQGGIKQEDRMIKDKWRTFLKTLQYSYQGCDVTLVQKHNNCAQVEGYYQKYRALINPDKTKQDYDDKILSIDYSTNFEPGDVFNWLGTDTNWLIYLQSLTEDAYFRGEIRRCRYKIKFKNEQGEVCETWAAIRGPVETEIESIQKSQIRVDIPNFSLHILMPFNADTSFAFNRYKRFLFNGRAWRVEAIDDVSCKNILEVQAEEYYVDRENDDVQNELANGLVVEPVDPNPEARTKLEGLTFIKPMIEEIYTAPAANGKWCIKEGSDYPVTFVNQTDTTVTLKWFKSTSGQFTLVWESDDDTRLEKTIVVESLF